MKNASHTREEIIQILKKLSADGEIPSTSALKRKGINGYWIRTLVPEGLSKLKESLGIRLTTQERPLADAELLEHIDRVFGELHQRPTWAQLERQTGITQKTFVGRFGKRGILEVFSHYRDWLLKQKPESPNLGVVTAYLEATGSTPQPARPPEPKRKSRAPAVKWPKNARRQYGAPLNFGSLVYEPINEQGVVFLFGMVSRQLGFSVEYIGTEFPDCEAKQYVEGRGQRQQHVRIEFEFRSRDFGHVVEDCDIIVCWEDNWGNECPLKVIELRTEIQKLRNLTEFSAK